MVYLEEIPKEMIYTSKNKYLAEKIIDEFFLNTEEYILSLYDNYNPSDFEIKFLEITFSGKIIDDKLTCLILNDEREHIVANVLCAKIKSGWDYLFFRDLSFLEKFYKI
jgi:hypothetical protein